VYRSLILGLLLCLSGYASAHEWTPTYPELKYSHVKGVMKVDMFLFNARTDVKFYEISVWDAMWNKVPFAAEMSILPMDYLGRKNVTIYIKESDKNRVTYICSQSKLQSDGSSQSSISSRVCSKIKG
jgi:hypothetical protein